MKIFLLISSWLATERNDADDINDFECPNSFLLGSSHHSFYALFAFVSLNNK